ncbi:F-box/FBD/LRR-repeat protein-like protein, partial [Tanacetum coccineum]
MPENVITNILDHLPIKDAVRTDILSKYWRFKYTMVTSLVFDYKFLRILPYKYKRKMVKIISRLLLHLKGPITKFVLYIPSRDDDDFLDVEDLDQWVLFLSRNGIEDLTLISLHDDPLELPTQVYSCRELKHLNLYNFCFHPSPKFIAQCPLLEILSNLDDEYYSTDQLELVEISKAKLGNLKILSWSLCSSDMPATMIKSSSIFQLAIHPKLQELNLCF